MDAFLKIITKTPKLILFKTTYIFLLWDQELVGQTLSNNQQ